MTNPGERREELVVAGWGRTQTEERSNVLQVRKFSLHNLNLLLQVLDLEEVPARQCRAEYRPLGVELLDRYFTSNV